MKKVTYISAAFDASGYAEAARNNMAALMEVGVPLEALSLSFEQFKSDLGVLGQKIKNISVPKSSGQINIIHTTPSIFKNFIDKSKYNIGYTTWETTHLPCGWTEEINKLDEVWVPCQQNVQIFKDSGVSIPIYCIPHTFNRSLFEQEAAEMKLQHLNKDDYVFYSVFQWTERKNPIAMLKAYFTEFKTDEKVCLILKTYMINPGNLSEKDKIKQAIQEVKSKLYLKNYPKILLIDDLLSRTQLHQLHKMSDCYLSFHRNEGFGVPVAEAMIAANPVISTNYGGTTDFVLENQTGYPVSYQMTPCYGMPWETYAGYMNWADINICDAKQKMRYVFNNREEAKYIGQTAQNWIDTNLSWKAVGNLMKDRLERINR